MRIVNGFLENILLQNLTETFCKIPSKITQSENERNLQRTVTSVGPKSV